MDRLPDPDLFRDALFLAPGTGWTAAALDETDALLVALITKFRNARVRHGQDQ